MIAALIVSVPAVVVAAASAVFTRSQVVQMRRQFEQEGPIIKMSASIGFPLALPTDRVQACVTATNTGRGQVRVQGWGFTVG